MRHQNMTFSIPDDLKACLFAKVGNRNRSLFISEAVRRALIEEEARAEKELDDAYEAANRDADRKEVLRDWDAVEDRWSDDDEDWSWLKKKKGKRKNG